VADEVSASACKQLLDALEDRGIGRSELLHGLSLSEEDLERPRGRISWSHFVAILDRAAERLGGPEALEEIGAEHGRRPIFRWFPAVARAAISPRDLYWLGRSYGQSLFRNVACRVEVVSSNRIMQTLTIPAEDPDSRAFFHLMRGALSSTPSFLGLPDSLVDMDLAPRRARYSIVPPRSLGLATRIFRRLRFSGFALREVVDELTLQHEELLGTFRDLMAAHADLKEQVDRRRRVEQELQRAQRLEAVGRLASGIAHDFNNVLTTISVCADLASEHIGNRAYLREDLARIRQAAERAAGVTHKLLAFTRSQPSRPIAVDVDGSIRQLQSVLRRLLGEPITLNSRLESRGTCVRIDPAQLDQVILNLVLNARDATAEAGFISVETSVVSLSKEQESGAGLREGRYVCMEVRDTGCGMDEETQSKIFDPFFTTKSVGSGTGLGLSIVHGIAQQAGGAVSVSSEPGKGTSVRVYFPATKGMEVRRRVPRTGAQSTKRIETVLFAEDDEDLRTMIHRSLRAVGYTVVTASDGEVASRLVGESSRPIDLLVTDIRMPGLNGWELADILRTHNPRLPVLYISGYPEDGSHRSLGVYESFLAKPFSVERLIGEMQGLLDGAEYGTT